jgi:hypothetical protein
MNRHALRVDQEKVVSILNYPAPKTVRQVRRFLGTSILIQEICSKTVEPLMTLLMKSKKYVWASELEEAFKAAMELLVSAPFLACSD